jgi:hypothetical protein
MIAKRQFSNACTIVLFSAVATIHAQNAVAAEGGSGVYILGLRGAGAGITAPAGVYFSNQFYIYDARIRGNIRLEGGSLVASVRAAALVNIPTLLWVTPAEVFGGKLGFSVTVPFGRLGIDANVGPLSISDRRLTFADPSVGTFLGWKFGDVHVQSGVTTFLPIGDYRKGEVANVSKNRLAADLYTTVTWAEPNTGIDITGIGGFTFSAENGATQYRTGNEFHLEGSISKKLTPQFMVGAVGYYYQQLSADSGQGASLGAFKGRAAAIGATAGFDFKAGDIPVSTRVRYYREIDVRNRFKGDTVFLSLSMPLWVQGAGR